MFVRLTKAFVIMALVATTGLHWAALQTVAWMTMLAKNLQSVSVSQALEKTFDGRHPCPLCRAIAAGKKSGQKTEFIVQAQKFEYPPAAERFVLFAPMQFHFLPQANTFAESLTHPPLTPPPRAAFV